MRLVVRAIIKFLGQVVVMLSHFPSPIATHLSNAALSATIEAADVADVIQRSDHFGFSRAHTPSRWATCSGSSTSEVCSSFSAASIFKFCGSPRTACRSVCPSPKHCRWILYWQCHFNTRAVFVVGPRTALCLFGCI